MNLKLAKHCLARRMTFRGLPISIETDKGELRHWFDVHENKSGTTKMTWPYGYIRRTEGVDGDHVDCYVGPNERAKNVYIVHQMKAPEFKVYDEDKCMLGFLSAKDAKEAYLAHYNKPGFFGSMTIMPFEEFEKKVKATFEEPKKLAGVIMPRKYANLAKAIAGKPDVALLQQILTRPSPALRGTLEIGAKGKRFIPEVEDISLETLRRQALRRPPAVAAKPSPMHYEPGDIMTSAKMSAFLKRAQAYGAHLATMEFHRHTRDDFTKEAISPARARAAAEVALKRGMPDRAKRFATKAQDISIARKAEMDYGATREEARAMMPKRFLKGADAALGDPNFWQGGSEAQQAPPQPASAEEAIGLLPGGTFQGLNTRITADGQRSTTVKTTPDVMQDPSGIQAIFAAEPGAKVELSNPETAMPGTAVPVQGDNGGVPEGSPGQETTPVSPIPEAAGKLAALIQAGRSQAREKLASMSTEDRLRKIGPAIGATAGLVSAALSKQPKTFGHVLSRVGGGATVGWLPDIYASGYEALR